MLVVINRSFDMMKTEAGKGTPDSMSEAEKLKFFATRQYEAGKRLANLDERAARAEDDPRYGSRTLEIIERSRKKTELLYKQAGTELAKLGW